MNFPTITIPDPAAVGKWLDEQLGDEHMVAHNPHFSDRGWSFLHYYKGKHLFSCEATPEEAMQKLREQIAEMDALTDPLAKLRKEAEAMGYALMKLPED